jgi:hypothetical protein
MINCVSPYTFHNVKKQSPDDHMRSIYYFCLVFLLLITAEEDKQVRSLERD